MKREVFVGSSSEALDKAKEVCGLFTCVTDSGTEPETCSVLWTEVFQPGFLTFEALERMLIRCCGAVFVATPDDVSVIRGHEVKAPRANIMLEFGLVAGRMGRHNIALCQYGGAELPSDLHGMTVINMEPPSDCDDPNAHRSRAYEKLRVWADRLVTTTSLVARTDIVHGYTGRWDFHVRLKKWRDLVVPPLGYVEVKGHFDLIMPAGAQTGRGTARAALLFRFPGEGGSRAFQGEYRTAHDVSNAFCTKDGTLELTTEAFAMQKVTMVGDAPPQLQDLDFQPEPWSARWVLAPTDKPRTLEGTVRTEGSVLSEGTVTLVKRFDSDL